MHKKPWLYSAPALLLILIVVVFPIGYTAYISLTNMNLYHWTDFRVIGLSNYVRALFKFDSGFLGALFTTLLWTVVNMALQLFCGFWIALGPVSYTHLDVYKRQALFRKSLFGAGLESTEAVDLCLKVQIVFPMRYGNGNQERRTDSSDTR